MTLAEPELYIHVPNWSRFLHYGTTRNRGGRPAWVKLYLADVLEQPAYLDLTARRRALYHGLIALYAAAQEGSSPEHDGSMTRAGVKHDRRRIGARLELEVRHADLEALNHAGLIRITASRLLAESPQDARRDGDGDGDILLSRAREPQPPPARETPSSPDTSEPGTSSTEQPPADELWDGLARMFGPVALGTRALGRRLEAHRELEAQGATVEELEPARAQWRKLGRSVELTDSSLARHFPQLRPAPAGSRPQPCPECEMGGGLHADGCTVGELEQREAGSFGEFLEGQA